MWSFHFVIALHLWSVVASGTTSPWILHEEHLDIPSGWTRARKLPSTSPIRLRIALAPSVTMDEMNSYLHDVSHPDSPNYGKHWTPEQVAAKFAAKNDTITAVHNWLVDSGIAPDRVKLSPSNGWLHVLNSTAGEAEELLHTKYHVYVHDTGVEHIATQRYHLPAHVVPHVDFVVPTIHFDAKIPTMTVSRSRNSTEKARRSGSWCEQIEPNCYRGLYGIPETPPSPAKQNGFGIVEYAPNAYLQKDLDMFAKQFSPSLVGKFPKQISIHGGTQQTKLKGSEYNGESDYDLQYAMSLVGEKQQVTLYQVGILAVDSMSDDNFLDAIDAFYCFSSFGNTQHDHTGGYKGPKACGTDKPTNVISSSHAAPEVAISNSYAARQCIEYGKLGVMGVTVLYSSGDSGVAGIYGQCGPSHGKAQTFVPMFPATCPFVTAVGGTELPSDSDNYKEVAWSGSGGGWSNYFAMPAYQADAVKYYLKHHQHGYPSDIWNSTGRSRAYPDISANANNILGAVNGLWTLGSGTSISAPVVGSIITLINDERIRAGKRPVGFINPALYSKKFAGAFTDITSGNNPGCGTQGFKTAKGWDPVAGLGTPKFAQLADAWLTLP
ncbi:peptidase S8/S53 domain-containing protein [Hygrophoropsis aurantiaca]|uniref:Peptidase S8/S53 domain-containing protein n=1 Tax=Hygrophoropsis aurantiaca TaxID=72124 RepID=A0ACB7ZUI1_9AGAM|nr:peptidase S8/S53 domain-containing protein [Hygrophoropsis aurantiaca]